MKGIQINNYFNNHITLNNKKINQPLPITNQPHMKTNNKNNKLHEPTPSNPHNNKSPTPKNQPLNLKKRTNTLVQLRKNLVEKRSISTQRHRNATSSKKREDLMQQSSEKQQQQLAHMSSRRLNINKGGLGKRSKSSIIKTSSHAETISINTKKQKKKVNSNPTNESIKPAPIKSKRKKSSKNSEIIKQNKMQPSSSTLTSKFLKKDITPYLSKQSKRQKLTLKIDKLVDKKQKDEKKTSRKGKQFAANSGKKGKPLSAREKKTKQSRFIEELKEKYQNQPIFNNTLVATNPIKVQYQSQNLDNEFLSVMSNLQKVLNSVSSKQKLKKQLQIINNKLNEFRLHSKSNYEEQFKDSSNKKEVQAQYIEEYVHSSHRNMEIKNMFISSAYEQEEDDEEAQQDEDDDEIQEEQKKQHEESLPKQRLNVDSIDRQRINDQIQIINNENVYENGNSSDEDDRYLKLHRQEQKNPLINKKHNIFFLEENIPEKEENLQRKKEIQLLKRFKLESAKMMQKVGLNQMKDNQGQKMSNGVIHNESIQKERNVSIDNASGILSNGSSNSYKEDRYPLASSLSPKFDEHQMITAISLKQQYLSSKHDKMSELVKKMFEKQLVSPKSYEFQMRYLNKKHEDENLVLLSFKKQAEQLSSMLSQIKKDKEEIKDIDELIRNQKWDEAQRLVIKKQIKQEITLERIIQDAEQHKWKVNPVQKEEQLAGWQKQEGWQRVQILKKDVQDNEFVEIGQMTNRGRRKAISRPNFDDQFGHTEESEDIQPHEMREQSDQECIYYNQQHDEENAPENNSSGGLIRLVEITHDQGLEFNDVGNLLQSNKNELKKEAEGIERNASALSALSASSSQLERKGFTTNLYFIKEYCIALCEFVRDNDNFKNPFKINVSKPLEFNILQTFQEFRNLQNNYPYIKRHFMPSIPGVIINEFNNQYQSLKFHFNNKAAERYQFQKDMELDFAKMVCDALNQSLDHERPGGVFGKALPWKETSKHLKNHKHFKQEEEDNIEAYDLMFGVAIARIIQWGSCLCGFLPDTVQLQNTQIDKNYVDHIRQSRMAVLLQKIMSEEQLIMTNFELQQTEIYFNLSQLIEKELLKELQEQLSRDFHH